MIVIKIGGGEGIDPGAAAEDIARLDAGGTAMVLVHGGSHPTNEISERLGHPPLFITSTSGQTSRRTDRRTLDIFMMVYCGLVNKSFVARLQAVGVNAVGLSGVDGALWQGRRKKVIRSVENGRTRIIRDDYTGVIEQVNTGLLRGLLERGYLPVLTPPGISERGEAINVDGDRAAARTAAALKAETLVFLSNVPGLLKKISDEKSLIHTIPKESIDSFEVFARGRMKKKLMGAREALAGGVTRVIISDARVGNPITSAIAGCGTLIS